jgi:hypothetical protein
MQYRKLQSQLLCFYFQLVRLNDRCHRLIDGGSRNKWNPNGWKDGCKVDEAGTVQAQTNFLLFLDKVEGLL